MMYRTEVVREGELMGPVDWNYDFLQHFQGYCCDAAGKEKLRDRAVEILRAISEPGEWEVLIAHSDWWKTVYSVGMYDGWPFWRPTPAMLLSGTLGPEWHFFYDLHGHRKAE